MPTLRQDGADTRRGHFLAPVSSEGAATSLLLHDGRERKRKAVVVSYLCLLLRAAFVRYAPQQLLSCSFLVTSATMGLCNGICPEVCFLLFCRAKKKRISTSVLPFPTSTLFSLCPWFAHSFVSAKSAQFSRVHSG